MTLASDRPCRRLFRLGAFATALAVLVLVARVPANGASAAVGPCPVMPADDVWNTPIDTLPADANSATYIATIGSGLGLKADFGAGLWDGGPIGIPFTTVTGAQTKYPVTFDYADESDPGPYAVPLNAPIEGGPNATGDRHAIAIDTDNCILYELFDAFPGTNSWSAGSGAIYNLASSALRPAGWTSADAAGLPIFPGLVRYDEIQAGVIRHAIRFTVPRTRNTYVWPARHQASSLTGAQYPPMGQRFRLKASFDVSGYSRTNQIILQALKTYGMILADNGSAWYMSGAPDERWDNDDLHALGAVLGSNFEAVDESSLMIDSNSGRARQPGGAYRVAWGTSTTPSTMSAGALSTVNVGFSNSGSQTWNSGGANPVRLSYHWRSGACAGTGTAVWDGLRTALPGDIAAGAGPVALAAQVQAPATAGTYCLQFDLVKEGVTWFSTAGAGMLSATVTVSVPQYGVSWGFNNTPGTMSAGSLSAVSLSFTNTGSMAWPAGGANPVRLSYHWLSGACPGNATVVWDGRRSNLPADAPSGGGVANLPAQVAAPAAAGTYCLRYDLVQEGITWFSARGAATWSKTVNVTVQQYAVTWGANSTPATMTAGALVPVTLSVTNAGTVAWNSGGANPVRISYHWRSGACPGTAGVVWDGVRTVMPADTGPGATAANVGAQVRAPAAAGTYCLQWDMVKEGITWFSSGGAAVWSKTVTVN